LYILGFPIGLAQGATGPAINALLFQRCSPQRRGTASAAFFSSIDIGFGVGSILFGFVAEALNFYYVFIGAALVAVLALVVHLWDMMKRKRNPVSGSL
jgi:predicted MFS family arabinose efflux permease